MVSPASHLPTNPRAGPAPVPSPSPTRETLERRYRQFLRGTRVVLALTVGLVATFCLLHAWACWRYAEYLFWADALAVTLPSGAILYLVVMFAHRRYPNWREQLVGLGFAAGYGVFLYFALFHRLSWTGVIGAGVVGWALVAAAGVAGVGSVVNLGRLGFLCRHRRRGTPTFKDRFRERIRENFPGARRWLLVALVVGGGVVIPTLALYPPSTYAREIPVQPGTHHADIALWGPWQAARYTPDEQAALAAHDVTIYHHTGGINYSLDLAEPNWTLSAHYLGNMSYWRDARPGVTFYPAIPGFFKGFTWAGAAEFTTELARRWIRAVQNHSLTNMGGICLDMEEPWGHYRAQHLAHDIDPHASATRHARAVAAWQAFFDWRDAHAPEMRVVLVNYVESAIDTFDGDADVQVAYKYPAFDVGRWDAYAPMVYRCPYLGPRPFGQYPDTPWYLLPPSHAWTYAQLDYLARAVTQTRGEPTTAAPQLGVFLGVTNCSCYGRDVRQDHTTGANATGFDSLVRDALIAKHFGVTEVTVFLATTFVENGYAMGGVFETYGPDFLDRFNASINGPGAGQSFTIRHEGRFHWNYYGNLAFFHDAFYEFGTPGGVVALGILWAACAWLVFRVKPAYELPRDSPLEAGEKKKTRKNERGV